jgi:hypothetical protein
MLSKADRGRDAQLPMWKNKAMTGAKGQKAAKLTVAEKMPIKRRQNVLREFGVFELLFGIILHYWGQFRE